MITKECIKAVTEYLKQVALTLKIPPDFEVGEFGEKTGMIEFGPSFTREKAEKLEQKLRYHPAIPQDGTLWLDEYIDVCGGEYEEGDERCLLFDVSDPEYFVITPEEIALHRKNFVIPIDEKWRNGPTNVYLPLRFKFFDDIKCGEKTVECREYTKNWVKRLLGPKIEKITFQRGYAPGAEKLVVEVTGIELEDEDERTRYSPDAIPDMATPALILIHLGRQVG